MSHNAMPPSLTVTLAEFAARLQFDDIAPPVVAKAKLHIIDTLGCGIAGARSDLARRLFDVVGRESRDGPCKVFGSSLGLGPAAAAFANAAAMNALDFDDGFEIAGRGMGHPGATIVAAAASAPFEHKVSGSRFLTAVVAAYEINNRLIAAMQPSYERFRQVYGVCQHQSVGAAVAYGLLTGLDAEALENAIGFAATLANVPSLRKYNWERRPLVSLKDFNAPVAESGVRAVTMTTCGLVGARSVLDGETGLWRMLGSDRFDSKGLVAGLGEHWTLANNSFKIYPVCRWMQTALEAVAALKTAHGLTAREIETVTVRTSAGMARDFMQTAPLTMVDAQFSLPFAVAAVALDIPVGAEWYEPRTMNRDDLRDFEHRVRAEVDPEIDSLMSGPLRRPSARVEIAARGRSFRSEMFEYPSGSAEQPISPAAVEAKFIANASPVIGAVAADQLLARLEGMEFERDMGATLAVAADPRPADGIVRKTL